MEKELKDFIKTQQESLSAHQAEEIAKINGFYQGASAAFAAVAQFIERKETSKHEQAVKEEVQKVTKKAKKEFDN